MAPTVRDAGVWLGVLGIAASFVGIAVAMSLAPWFSLTGNALSDLGASGRASAPAFNGGLLLGGLLGVGFAARLWPEAPGPAGRLGVVLIAAALGALALIGVFPTPHPYHLPVAITFYVSFTYALFVYGSGEALAGRVREGLASIWVGIMHVTVWFVWPFAGTHGVAIPEAAGALLLAIWVLRRAQRLRE